MWPLKLEGHMAWATAWIIEVSAKHFVPPRGSCARRRTLNRRSRPVMTCSRSSRAPRPRSSAFWCDRRLLPPCGLC